MTATSPGTNSTCPATPSMAEASGADEARCAMPLIQPGTTGRQQQRDGEHDTQPQQRGAERERRPPPVRNPAESAEIQVGSHDHGLVDLTGDLRRRIDDRGPTDRHHIAPHDRGRAETKRPPDNDDVIVGAAVDGCGAGNDHDRLARGDARRQLVVLGCAYARRRADREAASLLIAQTPVRRPAVSPWQGSVDSSACSPRRWDGEPQAEVPERQNPYVVSAFRRTRRIKMRTMGDQFEFGGEIAWRPTA